MGKPTGFLEYKRINPVKRPIKERLQNYNEFEELIPQSKITEQAARCIDCGIPYCHSYGCPVNNRIPDWNDMVYKNQWQRALELLHSTINFPEFTGRVCPAPCEHSCTLAINDSPVTIKQIELQIVERGWREGWIKPQPSEVKTGKKIAVIGSGPAGLTAAQQLVRKGHSVVVFEKSDRVGGILRYGIPDFKLEKRIIDRRLEQLKAEGIVFETGVNVGVDISARYLKRTYDAVVIAAGSTVPRDLNIPGRNFKGIHFAMEYLTQQNRINAGDNIPDAERISAFGKDVLVIGGGDTGSDCVGTANRQKARSVTQVEILPKPPESRITHNPWPTWPLVLFHSSSHDEGCERQWNFMAKHFINDEDGRVNKIKCCKLAWDSNTNGPRTFREIPDSEFIMNTDLILLAMGFIHVEHGPLVKDLNIETDTRGNIRVNSDYMSSEEGFFAAGDSVSGASLVVRAFNLGRRVAESVHAYLR